MPGILGRLVCKHAYRDWSSLDPVDRVLECRLRINAPDGRQHSRKVLVMALLAYRKSFFAFLAMAIVGLVPHAFSQESQEDDEKNLYAPAPFIPDGTRNQNPSEGKLKGQTLRIKRVLLMVKDLERSLEFYEHVIGFEVYAVDQVYSLDQTTIGNKIFNTPFGTRRRIAQLNTSNETRGIALREIDADFDVPQSPRLSTVLLEASDIMGIHDRAIEYGAEVIGPNIAIVPERENAPRLRYMEMAVVDPEGHLVTFFKYYLDTPEDDEEWEAAAKKYKLDVEL